MFSPHRRRALGPWFDPDPMPWNPGPLGPGTLNPGPETRNPRPAPAPAPARHAPARAGARSPGPVPKPSALSRRVSGSGPGPLQHIRTQFSKFPSLWFGFLLPSVWESLQVCRLLGFGYTLHHVFIYFQRFSGPRSPGSGPRVPEPRAPGPRAFSRKVWGPGPAPPRARARALARQGLEFL